MIEFISRRHANDDFEVIVRTNNEEYYKAVIDLARQLIDHSNNGTTVHFNPVVPGSTDCYTISEMSYNNGYAKGVEAGKQKWIPVSERLPEELGLFLVIEKHWIDGSPCRRIAKWNTLDWFTADRRSREITPRVTHWMPLPSTEGLK